ncbi:MAG: bifunctional riboflavin kinase/FAD synthetase [Proteobacteria bacterium]|nr:bifunctional riboflavin kinase/FAD synthetase [Pseudomonadota bacterium]
MKFIRYPQYRALNTGTVVTIGNFDGVHIGHQALIQQVTDFAQDNQLQSVVVTMQPLAAEYFAGKDKVALLTPFKCKYKLLKALNVDIVCMLNFNKTLSDYSAVEFIQNVLLDGLQARHIIVGDDFRFGKNRAGDFNTLKKYCQPLGSSVNNINSVTCNGDRVSSSKVRQYLFASNFLAVSKCLGREYCITGKVSQGQQLGRKLGFPTINLNLGVRKIPVNGVFCVKVRFADKQEYIGAANIGTRPTVNGVTNILEVHILDFNKQVYRQNVEVLFYHKIRNEVKFDSLNELKRHINDDVNKTRQFFNKMQQRVQR